MRFFPIIFIILTFSNFCLSGEKLRITVDQAVELALERNRSLKVARNRVYSSEYQVKDSRTRFFPNFSTNGTYIRLDERPYIDASGFGKMFEPLMAPFNALVDSNFLDPSVLSGLMGDGGADRIYVGQQDIYNINISIQQPIFAGGALLNSYKIAQLSEEAEGWNFRRDENRVRYDVIGAYLGLVKAGDYSTITGESIKQMQAHITDLENLLQAGMIIRNDLLRAQVQLSNVRLLHSRANNGVQLANAHLCHLLALDLETEIVPVEIPESLYQLDGNLDSYTMKAWRNRPELRVMEINKSIGKRLIDIQRGKYLPTLALIGNYDWKRPDRQYEPEFYGSWNISLALQMNLFNWGSTHFNIQKAKISHNQISESYEMLAEGISLEVKQAYLNLNEAREALQIAEENIVQADENFRVTSENFHEGLATNADLLDAQTLLTRAKIERATVHADLLLAQAKLSLATADYN